MSSRGASVRDVGAVAVVVSLIALWFVPALAQPDTHVGTWVLNVAKSKYNPGPPPKEQTTVIEAAGNGIKVADGLGQQGFAHLPHAFGIIRRPGRQEIGNFLGQCRAQAGTLVGQFQEMRNFFGGGHGRSFARILPQQA